MKKLQYIVFPDITNGEDLGEVCDIERLVYIIRKMSFKFPNETIRIKHYTDKPIEHSLFEHYKYN